MRKAYEDLTADQKKLVSEDSVKRLEAIEEALVKAGEIKEEVNVNHLGGRFFASLRMTTKRSLSS